MNKQIKPFTRSNKEEIISALWFIVGFLSMSHVYAWVYWLIFAHASLSLLAGIHLALVDAFKNKEDERAELDVLNEEAAAHTPQTKATT